MIAQRLGLPSVTGMEPENPGVGVYRDYHNEKVFLFPTMEMATGMAHALSVMARLRCGWPLAMQSPVLLKKDTSHAVFGG